jgi:hypothetical protein
MEWAHFSGQTAVFTKVNGGIAERMVEANFQAEMARFTRENGSMASIMEEENFKHRTEKYLLGPLKMVNF